MSTVRARALSVSAAFSDSGWRMGLCATSKGAIARNIDATSDTPMLADARRGSSKRLRSVRPNDALIFGLPARENVGLQPAKARHHGDVFHARRRLQRIADRFEIVGLEAARWAVDRDDRRWRCERRPAALRRRTPRTRRAPGRSSRSASQVSQLGSRSA